MAKDNWSLVRVGQAAAATTPPGQVTQYGLAYDLGTAQWDSQAQFDGMIRDQLARQVGQQIQQIIFGASPIPFSTTSPQDIVAEMERAVNYQEHGKFVTDADLKKSDFDFKKSPIDPDNIMAGVNLVKESAKDEGSDFLHAFSPTGIKEDVGQLFDGQFFGEPEPEQSESDVFYRAYRNNGGILPKKHFASFDIETQQYLSERASSTNTVKDIADTPGIKHALVGLDKAYRGVQTPFIMFGNTEEMNPLRAMVDPNWIKGGEWARAWRESQDLSLGNAITNSILDPYVSDDRLDRWKRDSSLYQLSSLGVELGAGWYLDAGVIAGQGVGATARLARGEMPLHQTGRLYRAQTQALQREQVTVGGLTGQFGKYRAKRMQNRWDEVANAARTQTYADFANQPMFRKRDVEGQSAAAALYWAFNKAPESDVSLADLVKANDGSLNYPDFPSLTQQLLHGDPKAYEDLHKLHQAAPEEIEKFAPGAQTFIDAIEATKTKIPLLQKEADELAEAEPGSTTHEWLKHTPLDQRLADIQEATDVLNKYEGYRGWLDNMSREPSVSRVQAKQRFYLDSQYGKSHKMVEWTRPLWLQKANVMEMHDVDTGAMSIRRQFEQYEHLFGYRNPEALDDALQKWQTAPTSYDRYNLAMDIEEQHLVGAAAERFGASPEVIRGIYRKVLTEQNKLMASIRQGDGSIYSTAPSLQDRLRSGGNAQLVSRDPDNGTVTIELMDGGRRTTVTVPEEALSPKERPVDPTQTPNYYQPIDTRRFYLELKRDPEFLQNASQLTGAALMDMIDTVGTKFNALWKPLQLFRFGWPQRVLMDEQARALAILGIPAFARYYGSDTARSVNNAALKLSALDRKVWDSAIHGPYVKWRYGKDQTNLGPGPVTDRLRRTQDPVLRDEEILNAPKVPESLFPRTDMARLARVDGFIGAEDAYQHMPHLGDRPSHPLNRSLAAFDADTATDWQIGKNAKGPRVYDPISGSPVNSGYAIPLQHFTMSRDDAMAWYSQNRELLGSPGVRVFIDDDGITVARWFNKKRRTAAAAFAQYAEADVYDLGRKVTWKVETPRPELADDMIRAEVANGELRAQERGFGEDLDLDFDMMLDDIGSSLIRRRASGVGTTKMMSSDGQVIEYRNAYEGHDGELFRSLISSQSAIEALSDGHGAATSLFRRQAQGHKTYHPPVMDDAAKTVGTPQNRQALEYFSKWADLLNSQVAHSPVWGKMLNGWSDAKIASWLDETPEGARAKREVMHEYRDSELWVNEHRAKLDYYLPNKKLQRLLGKGKLSTSQLRREIKEDDYPDVFGPDVEFLDKRTAAGKTLSWIADRIWYGLGTVPVDTLSRHPFARAMYDTRMRTLIASTDSKWLDEKTIARFERQSRNYAREQVRKTLWDLTDATNFSDALRFMAPFWGAQYEALTKWGKIVSDRPETVMRAFNTQRAVYNNFVVVDEDGQPVEREYLSYNPGDRIIFRVPEGMKGTEFGKALMTIGEIGVPIGSANTVLQGEAPLLPGPGPVVTIPADKFLNTAHNFLPWFKDTRGTEFDENYLYRWLFPVGRPQHGGVRGILDQVSPGWGKRVMQMSEGDGGIAYANLFSETAREMQLANQEAGKPPPTPDEIEKQARWVWGLRVFAGLTAPVQTQFRPKHQFLIDAAHKYQRDYGIDWFDKFMKDYGTTVARYATSSSNSTVGIPPTSEGMEEWSANRKLIAKYPEWGGAIISPDAYTDDFSSDAYYAQFELNLGPGDSTPVREPLSTKERFDQADARAGWYEFRQVDATLDAELVARGLHSLQQKGAEDLAEIKANFVSDLSKRLPAWRAEYDNFNNDIYTRINELREWAFNDEFENRPDIQGVRQYMILRDQVGDELDAYAANMGGSRSLQAEENTALREWFYGQVGQLRAANPAFAEFYSRYLTQDTLERGSGN